MSKNLNFPYTQFGLDTNIQVSDYDQQRNNSKNSFFVSLMMYLKSALGLGLMVIPLHYALNGYLFGASIVIIVCFNMMICSLFYIKVVDDIEQNQNLKTFDNMESVCLYTTSNKSFNLFLYYLIKVQILNPRS